jgi:hypothetical protein
LIHHELLVESAPPFALSPAPKPGKCCCNSTQMKGSVYLLLSAQTVCLVLGEKYHKGWKAQIDGKPAEIVPVNHILRGVYLTPGKHTVEFRFDPLPFKIGKWLTLGSFALFGVVALREWWLRRREHGSTV